MALYKYGSYFQESKDTAFDTDHIPGNSAPYAGIFRCMGCGREIGIASGHVLPPQSHHSHTSTLGIIRWRLIAYADHEPK